jgi:hypothetical protein
MRLKTIRISTVIRRYSGTLRELTIAVCALPWKWRSAAIVVSRREPPNPEEETQNLKTRRFPISAIQP